MMIASKTFKRNILVKIKQKKVNRYLSNFKQPRLFFYKLSLFIRLLII